MSQETAVARLALRIDRRAARYGGWLTWTARGLALTYVVAIDIVWALMRSAGWLSWLGLALFDLALAAAWWLGRTSS